MPPKQLLSSVSCSFTVEEESSRNYFFVVTGQVNTLTKLLKNEKTPFFRNLVLLPLLVQQDADPDIQVITKKLYNFISSLSQGLNSSFRIFF